jgi:CRISPR/Cas system-associated endoribonuclease Cas2
MPVYLISYDLLNKATFGEYEQLIAELKRMGARRVLYSEWMLRTNNTALEITNRLRKQIHGSDRIMVIAVDMSNGAIANLMCRIDDI